MTLRAWTILIALLFAVAGGTLLYRSAHTPEWKDQTKVAELMAQPEPNVLSGPEYEQYTTDWYRSMDALRTNRWPLFDLGSGLIALAGSALAAFVLLRIGTTQDIVELRTPSKISIIAICSLAWFGIFAAEIFSLFQDFNRWEFPTWADSMAIPIFEMIVTAVIGWSIAALLTWFIVLRPALLPMSLWVWSRRKRDIFFTVCALLSLTVAVNMFFDVLTNGPFIEIPFLMLWMYATLLVRAAAVSRRTQVALSKPLRQS